MIEPQYRVRVADDAYWREQIKCQFACPVHTDARGYVRVIAEGDYQEAYLIARGPNPLASLCGRICGAPREAACRRGTIDQPIAIRALKRFVCERFGPESRSRNQREEKFLTCADSLFLPTFVQKLCGRSSRRHPRRTISASGSR